MEPEDFLWGFITLGICAIVVMAVGLIPIPA